ncbi:MAG: hypothetical protein WC661_09400 [Opitutaceae bacterium]|jgi:hypothetical protein
MKRPLLAALLGLCLSTLAPAAESLETQIKAFQQTVTAALAKTPSTTPGDRRGESAAYAVAGLSQLSAANNNSNPQELDRMVASVVALTQNDPAVAKAAETLLATAKSERQARIDRARAAVDALLKQTGEACLDAKIPADLDATLAALAPYGRNSGYDRRIDDQESWQRGANAYRFVTRWQDYLGFLAQGSVNEATSTLRELSNSVDVGIMPRSRILTLLAPSTAATPQTAAAAADPLAAVTDKLAQAKTLEDFIAVARLLSANSRNNQHPSGSLRQVVANLIEDRQQVLAGNRPNALLSDAYSNSRQLSAQDSAYNPDAQTAMLAFRRETQIAGIRLALTGATPPTGKPDETIEAYLTRIAEKFVADNNWLQVRETLELYRTLFSNNGRAPSWLTGDIDACTAYLAARNLDLAGQYPSAIASYRRALRNAGRYVPAEAIGARLAELKKTNPEAFADPVASENDTGSPAARIYGQQSGGLPPGYIPASMPRNTGAPRPPAPTGPTTPAATP